MYNHISLFKKAYITDIIKTKRTAAFKLATFGGLLIISIVFLIFFFKGHEILKPNSTVSWMIYIQKCYESIAYFLLPMYIILQTSLLVNIEHKSNTWKHVYTFPIPKFTIFISKYFSILSYIIYTIIMFWVFIFVSGLILMITKPALGFDKFNFEFMRIVVLSLKLFISALGYSAIQFVLSYNFKNFVASTGIGMGALIAGLILMQWEYNYLIPHTQTILSFVKLLETKEIHTFCFYKSELFSIAYCVITLSLGYFISLKRKII